ncbi:MAG: efflux RND transporter periplasmic adaptor subunit [Pseudomonadales bacterium]|nr:efflux RND transporter periplasmic adaptor subunit [Pseudomonadales bacterium]MCP5168006.1 efflux RND transporter periplasmic adaptor subunit [Pseudomonadales bacterium]MCP5188377.1 efflux RND transporter periplasmic adaptor subunit [Pseudomonadales bacterium]
MTGLWPRILSISLALLALVACGDGRQAAPEPASRPVKVFVVEGSEVDAVRSFPGKVDASQRAELAFRVGGQLQELPVKEGDLVKKGQVLARLDPTDYKLILEDRQARFDNTERNFKRARDLVADGNISRLDFDRMEAEYRSASAALSQARKDLEYTVLIAPFAGRVAQRDVENFEEVMAKQTVMWLQNIDQLDIVINLPESVVRSVRGGVSREVGDGGHTDPAVRATAQFEGRGDQTFPLRPKEIATKADPQTQTFRATFTMAAPTKFTVLPGMTATVLLDLSELVTYESVKWVPARAVQADSGLNPRVWLLDPETMTVSSRPVSIGRMSGSMIEITDGLAGGEEIVAVGAPYLAQGMRVTRMADTEQAVPRAGDPG